MDLYRYDLESNTFCEPTTRTGNSSKLKWQYVGDQVFLKDITFGVCHCPFDPGKTSFRRNPFSPYTNKDYGIAIKGTRLTRMEYNDLVDDATPKVNPLINRLFYTYGERFWTSFPHLVKAYKEANTWSVVRSSPDSRGTFNHEAQRRFPYWESIIGVSVEDYRKTFFVPSPIKAMRFVMTGSSMSLVFNEGATVKTWHDHHSLINSQWREIVSTRAAAEAA